MVRSGPCPDPEVAAAYLDRQLAVSERLRFEEHVGRCAACATLVADSIRTLTEMPERIPVHRPAETPADNIVWTRPVEEGSPGSVPQGNVVWTDTSNQARPSGNVVWTRTVWGRDPSGHDGSTMRGRRERPYWGAMAAAATIVAMLSAPMLVTRLQPRDAGLADLADAVGTSRLVEGRLTGGFPHAPLGAPLAGGQGGATVETVRLELAAGKIREDIDRRSTPTRMHALGVSQLLLHRYDQAVMALAAAVREQPHNARFLNDAATAYLERARHAGRADDVPRALAAAERARAADPSLDEAWFNRALALSALSLRDQARQAWTEYLQRDSSSPWAGEARKYLAAESGETPAIRWLGVEALLRDNVTASVADEAVRIQTTNARQFVESELLPAWAEAAARGADASGSREALRVLADAFSRVAGDDLYRDAVAAIDRAESSGGDAVHRLAAAHSAYARAHTLFANERLTDAAPGLAAARDGFAASGSPFELRAAIDLVVCTYVRGETDAAVASLSRIESVAKPRHYAYIAARVSWLQGLIAFGAGRLAEAGAKYEATLQAFQDIGDEEQDAFVHGLLAGLHDYLGDEALAWQHRTSALRLLFIAGSPRYKHSVLMSAVGAALKQRNLEGALLLQQALVSNAQAWGLAAALSEAMVQRAAILAMAGRTSQSWTQLAEARASLAAVQEPAQRSRREAAILSVESDLLRQSKPDDAAAAAEGAIKLSVSLKLTGNLPGLYLQLARARAAAGRAGDAEQAIRQGIAAIRQQNEELSRAGGLALAGGTASGDEARQLYSMAVRFALDHRDLPRAFELSEAARRRAFDGAEPQQIASLGSVELSLLPDEAVLALSQFDDELVVWLIRRSGTEIVRRPLRRQDAALLTGRFRDEIALSAARPAAGAALFNELIRPLAGSLRGVQQLAIVPDASYEAVAFAGLWDHQRRRFLIEDRVLRVAASVASATGDRRSRLAGQAALVDVGGGVTATRALDLLAGIPDRAVVAVAAPVRSNGNAPLLSHIDFADLPDRPYSGIVLVRDASTTGLARAGTVILSQVMGGATLSVANALLQSGVGAVVGPVTPSENDRAAATLLDDMRTTLVRDASAVESVGAFQRDALRQNGHRLGAWSNWMVYGAGR